MEMSDSTTLPAGREAVWQALNDPEVLRQCIPGCEEIEIISPTELTAKVRIKIGPIKARFAGGVTLSDLDPPSGYVLSGEGQGGVAGFAKGTARVTLEEISAQETIMHYEARVDVSGKIAQLGARLLDGTAKKLAKQFFDDFGRVVSERPNGAEDKTSVRAGGEPALACAEAEGPTL